MPGSYQPAAKTTDKDEMATLDKVGDRPGGALKFTPSKDLVNYPTRAATRFVPESTGCTNREAAEKEGGSL